VTIIEHGKDKHGRTIADIVLPDGNNVSQQLVKEGLAWWFFKYSKDETLKTSEMEAREGKRGLWDDPIPTPPWVFRKIQKKQVPDISDFEYPGRTLLAILANKKSLAYRHPGCKEYIGMLKQKSLITFDKVEEAEEAGYHRAPIVREP